MNFKNLIKSLAAIALLFSLGSCSNDKDDTVVIPEDPNKDEVVEEGNKEGETGTETGTETKKPVNHIFLCLGQSNMEGNAGILEKDMTVNPRFQSYVAFAGQYDGKDYKVGDVRPAIPPLCRSGQPGGIGVTDYFGRTLIEKLPENDKVSVVVVAIGGTAIDGFLEEYRTAYLNKMKSEGVTWLLNYYKCYDNKPYARLIQVAKIAMKDGQIDGILFHQGESDAYSPDWNKKVKQVYDNICKDLSLDPNKTPFLAGNVTGNGNQCIKDIPQYIKNSYVISSANCQNDKKGENGTVAPGYDNSVHFNHAGYELLGKRYADKMYSLMTK